MWIYEQSTGKLLHNSRVVSVGYAGKGIGKNNPRFQHVKNEGPLPCGFYVIGTPYNSPNVGPFAIPLMPDSGNEMFGRSAFRIHGDSKSDPGNASDGCMIFNRDVRTEVDKSLDTILKVVPGVSPIA